MIDFLKKYNIHIFIVLVAFLTVYDFLNWESISIVRKLVNLFAVLAILHEIEEKYWPGGFHALMFKKMNVDIKRERMMKIMNHLRKSLQLALIKKKVI